MSKFYEKVAYRDVEEDIKSQKSVDKWIFGLLLIVIGFVPLIVMASIVEVQSPLITNVSALTGGTKGDLFTHYKGLAVLVITLLASIMFMAKILFMNGEIRKTKLNYAIGAFAAAIVLSTIFSPNISIALHGQYNRTDGAISWLCYLALFFIAMNIDYPKKAIQYIVYATIPFVLINFVIITLNFYGKDLLQKGWAKKFFTAFLPEGASLGEGSVLLGTLNHGNYMSGMFAVIVIMFLAKSILDKKIFNKIISFVIAIIAVFVVFMSLSTSGFLTIVAMMIFILWIALKNEKRVIAFIQIVAFCAISVAGIHILAGENSKVWDETFGFFVSSNPYKEEAAVLNKNLFDLDKAYASDNTFELPEIAPSGVGAGSGRVYIWTYIMDLVKERPILGYGLDTLIYNFPHYNKDARANLETEAVIVDKPHNMYIGVLYGTGIIGFIAFLVLLAFTMFNSLKIILSGKNSLVVLAVAVIAFLFQAIFNDTLPGVTATMMVILGMSSIQIDINKFNLT
ncbi:O-antigen ligase family protein [Lysinibacillus capsici]|uniref:O-antigen ligase family protein n=1 Tax=Lysinibacillus capsici TaxID=2115968 RepID=UPI001CD9D5E2|nr:O-antigen ligase family protein [Lysinibacillus capsici]